MRASGSALGILAAGCGYYLRDDVPWSDEEPGDAARFGNAIHWLASEFLLHNDPSTSGPGWHRAFEDPQLVGDACAKFGVDLQEVARAERVWRVARAYILERCRLGWMPEIPLAWDAATDTARQLPSEGHRDYSACIATEIPGTADVATMDDATAVVFDWKTGVSELDSYAEQAAFLALAWARVTGADDARAVFVRLTEDGYEERVWNFNAMDLDAIAARLTERLASVADAAPSPGPHCLEGHCKAFRGCPATHALVRTHEDTAPLAELLTAALTTPEDAGRAYLAVQRAKRAIKLISDRVQEIALEAHKRGERCPTSAGKELAVYHRSREYYSADRIPPERRDAVETELRELGALKRSEWDEVREVNTRKTSRT